MTKRESTPPELIQRLPAGPLDLIGDIHGERAALERLLGRLGVNVERGSCERPLVFVGDLIDRGPDSPGVIEIVRELIERGVAYAIAGNHELNLLLGLKKEGNGWFFGHDDRFQLKRGDQVESGPFQSRAVDPQAREGIRDFCAQLPLALVREDLRVVHACWDEPQLARLPQRGWLSRLEEGYVQALDQDKELRAASREELKLFNGLRDIHCRPNQRLECFMRRGLRLQNENPIALLTSGRERPIADLDELKFEGGKWRLLRRDDWWHRYQGDASVVVGHYWRQREGDGGPGWRAPTFRSWLGDRGKVFCIDYSVGRRYRERHLAQGQPVAFQGGLAALRWPERQLVFDDREGVVETVGWGGP